MKKVTKYPRIKPKFVKDSNGKTVQVFLDLKSYESMMARIKEFELIKKKFKKTQKRIQQENV